ncbi:hypothetical protein CPB84DRAFT_1856678 [Gymnopilus junonius]|uniref:Uncharacterized protein n=1 Tax=Gymnopilus junonius TaxID=109634 RepID=A0A9P5N6T1_GYMJU|nr:hypothetical protein CPB84DRAFT_1856678 [Gymnopilus junonius]
MPPKSKQTSDAAAWFKSIVVTRKMNKDAHPGQIVHGNGRKRRKNRSKKRTFTLQLPSKTSLELCCEDIECNAPRPVTAQPTFHLPVRASSTMVDVVTQSEPREDEQDNKGEGNMVNVEQDHVDSGESDVYDPEGDDGGDESEVEAEAMSDDELGDKPSKPVTKGQKAKTGRADISALRQTIPTAAPTFHSITPTTAETKCKADANHERRLSKKAKKNDPKHGPAGMIKGWQVAEDAKLAASLQAKTNEEEDSMVHMGRFVGDEETDDVKHLALSSLMKTLKKLLPSIIKVTEAKSGPPAHMKKDAHVTPKVRILAGTMPSAWKGLSVPQIQSLVDEVYGAGTHTVKHDSPWWDLVSYRLSDWCSHFVKHARIAVVNHMAVFDYVEEEYTKEDLTEYIKKYTLLEGKQAPTARFHWGSWEVDDEDDMRVKCKYDDEMPIGALILALQAVEHAFKFWTTGEFVEDSKLKFNADTYDDLLECKKKPDRSVKEVLTHRSSLYLPSVQSLKKKHWVSIFEAASAILGQSKVGKKKKGCSKSASSAASSEVELEESMPVFTLHSNEDSDKE